MKKNGFTLIELLAVVALLGIIALIAVTTIRDFMRDSKQKLYDEQILQIEQGLKNWANANIFLLPDDNNSIRLSLGQLKQDGFVESKISNPKTGKCFSNESTLIITKHNNSYIYEVEKISDVDCSLIEDTPTIKLDGSVVEHLYIGDVYVDEGATAKSGSGDDITSDITSNITGTGTSIDTSIEGNYTITYTVTNNGSTATAIRNVSVIYKYTNGIMSSMDNCINIGKCEAGTKVNVKVNNREKYDFYVINDNTTELTLIMDRNLGGKVMWATADDYAMANTDSTSCSTASCTDEGPVTAVAILKERTAGWINIPERDYTYSDDGGGNKYEGFTETMRARMLTYTEATTTLGCDTSTNGSCPSWLYTNLSSSNTTEQTYGYWTSSANRWSVTWAHIIIYDGYVFGSDSYRDTVNGLRPVIELSK